MDGGGEFGHAFLGFTREAVAIVRRDNEAARFRRPPGDNDFRAMRPRLELGRSALAEWFGLAVTPVWLVASSPDVLAEARPA